MQDTKLILSKALVNLMQEVGTEFVEGDLVTGRQMAEEVSKYIIDNYATIATINLKVLRVEHDAWL